MCFAILRLLMCVNFLPRVLACTPFTMVSYFFMWYLPPFVSGRVAWYLTFYCLFQSLTTVSRLQVMMFSAETCLLAIYIKAFIFSKLVFIFTSTSGEFKGQADAPLSKSLQVDGFC